MKDTVLFVAFFLGILFLASLVTACGSDGASERCENVFINGDNSQAACSGEGDATNVQENNDDDPEFDTALGAFCEELCIGRGNRPEGIREGDCFKECVEEQSPSVL